MFSKFKIVSKDGTNVVYKRNFSFCYSPYVVEDSLGLSYHLESTDIEKLEKAIKGIQERGWIPHDTTITKRIENG